MASVYEMVTARIIEQLEQGIIPWHKPWTGTAGAWSRSTGRPYSLLNQWPSGLVMQPMAVTSPHKCRVGMLTEEQRRMKNEVCTD